MGLVHVIILHNRRTTPEGRSGHAVWRKVAAVATAFWIAGLAGCGAGGATGPEATATGAPEVSATPAPVNIYAHTSPADVGPVAAGARSLVYVPDSDSDTVEVIDPNTFKVVDKFTTGARPQHVVPAWDMSALYVANNDGNSLTPINPKTGRVSGPNIPVEDPYNMYFTPDGKYAIVVAEALERLDFYNPKTWKVEHQIKVACPGVDHLDFSADLTYFLASCEFAGKMVKVDLAGMSVAGYVDVGGMPQDVRLDPQGKVFYIADMHSGGVHLVDGEHLKKIGFIPTGAGAHGIYPSRDASVFYVSNRGEGSISVVDPTTRKVSKTWRLPGGGSPDMGGVSVDGKVLWLTGRYNSEVYAISTDDGRLLQRIPVGAGPHGAAVWPQPGQFSLGHTGNMR
jgi:YVTN family beta-propeller protein